MIINKFKNNVGIFTEHAVDTYVGKSFYNTIKKQVMLILGYGICLIHHSSTI